MDAKSITLETFDENVSQSNNEVGNKTYMPTKSDKPQTSFNINNIYSSMLVKGLEDGDSPFLPKNGVVDLKPAYNLYSNDLHKNIAQVNLQLHAAKNGFKDMAYVSLNTLLAAREAAAAKGEVCGYKKGSYPVSTFTKLRDDAGNFTDKEKRTDWYNIAQIENPEFLKDFCKEHQQARQYELEDSIAKTQANLEATNDPDKQLKLNKILNSMKKEKAVFDIDRSATKENTLTFAPNEKEASSYLGAILAAMSLNTKLEVDDATAKVMASKMRVAIKNEQLSQNGKVIPQAGRYTKFIQEANDSCREKIKIIRDENSMKHSQEQIKENLNKAPQEKKMTKKPKTKERNFERGM